MSASKISIEKIDEYVVYNTYFQVWLPLLAATFFVYTMMFMYVYTAYLYKNQNAESETRIPITTSVEVGTSPLQEFDTVPVNTEVNPGESTVLVCKIRNRKGECAWLKDGRVVGKIANKYDFEREPSDGDCSIRIRNSRIEDDDGIWECQVTQTSISELTLTSPEVKYTVREAPMAPRIEDNTIQIQPGESFRTRSGESRRVHCVSRKGNPPAILRWYIDDQEITSMSNQTNATDPDKAKTWQATSVLDYTFHKEHNEKTLECKAFHAAYESQFLAIKVRLEVLYPPIIKLQGNAKEDIEEGKSLSLECVADANPKANIIWRKSGHSGIYGIMDKIDFPSIKRTDTGTYSCYAKNEIGLSEELEVVVDVKYRPKILKIEPSPASTVALYNTTRLTCTAEGNPLPKYSWLQKMGGEPIVWLERGTNSTLLVNNVTYMYQGKYICEVSNMINGKEYKASSEEIAIDVTGAPQVVTNTSKTKPRVVVEKGEDATMSVFFCCDPQPRKTFWEWGSLKLETGSDSMRYIADPLLPDVGQRDCYEARLIVQSADGSDSRKYTLNVENEKGRESYAVLLEVREPVAVSVVIGIVVGCIVLLIIVILVVLYLLKSDRLCFSGNRRFKRDTGSESESGHLAEVAASRCTGAIPPDALYASPKRNTPVVVTPAEPHYENLKPERNNGSIVYAHLDLAESDNAVPRQRQDPIEYAEIQFQPKVVDQVDI